MATAERDNWRKKTENGRRQKKGKWLKKGKEEKSDLGARIFRFIPTSIYLSPVYNVREFLAKSSGLSPLRCGSGGKADG